MRKTVFAFGIIAGAIVSAMMLISFSGKEIDFKNGELIGYASMIIAFSAIFFGIKAYRDKYLNGIINFGKAFRVGLYITLVASFMYVASWMLISNTYAKDFMNQYAQYTLEEMQQSGKSQAEIDMQLENIEKFQELYKNPMIKIGMTFLEIFPVGLVITLICAAILRRSDNSGRLKFNSGITNAH